MDRASGLTICGFRPRSETRSAGPGGLCGHPDPTPDPNWIPLLTLGSHDDLDWSWHDGDYLHVFVETRQLLDRTLLNLKADAG